MSPRNGTRENDELRLRVVAVGGLHLAANGRSLCGRVMADERDLYRDQAGLLAWNTGPLERCAQCTTALVARSRDPEQADGGAAGRERDARSGHTGGSSSGAGALRTGQGGDVHARTTNGRALRHRSTR